MNPGNDLLSHTPAGAVSSALEGLTSVFGMGTGVAPPVTPPETAADGQRQTVTALVGAVKSMPLPYISYLLNRHRIKIKYAL